MERFARFTRRQVQSILAPGETFTKGSGRWGMPGIVRLIDRPRDFVFFVTFGRSESGHDFNEGITQDGVLSWQSQPRQSLASKQIQQFINHDELSDNIYLFLRPNKKGSTPYTYLGKLKYVWHDESKEKPVYFEWQILDWDPPSDFESTSGIELVPSNKAKPVRDEQSANSLSSLAQDPPERSDASKQRRRTFDAKGSVGGTDRDKENSNLDEPVRNSLFASSKNASLILGRQISQMP